MTQIPISLSVSVVVIDVFQMIQVAVTEYQFIVCLQQFFNLPLEILAVSHMGQRIYGSLLFLLSCLFLQDALALL